MGHREGTVRNCGCIMIHTKQSHSHSISSVHFFLCLTEDCYSTSFLECSRHAQAIMYGATVLYFSVFKFI